MNQDELEINLLSLTALCIRKGKAILICTLAAGLLLGGLKLVLIQRDGTSYEEALAAYQDTLDNYKIQLEMTENQIAAQREYIDNSVYMRIDPSHVFRTRIYFDIHIDDLSALEQPYGQDVTPMDYLVTKVVNRYRAAWNQADMEKELAFSGLNDRYLREIVSLQVDAANSLISIVAMGDSSESSEALAEQAYAFLLSQTASVSDASYSHTLTRISSTTQETQNSHLLEDQAATYTLLQEYMESREELQDQIKELSPPDSPAKETIKRALIGALLGFCLSCGWIFLKSVLSGTMDDPYVLEDFFHIPLLGSFYQPKGIFDKWACRILRLRTADDPHSTAEYVAGKAKLLLDGEQTVLLTSSTLVPGNLAENIAGSLHDTAKEVFVADDFSRASKAMEALNSCDSVILAEKLGRAKINDVRKLLTTVSAAGKSVKGYILF